jgi:hypothetical protein
VHFDGIDGNFIDERYYKKTQYIEWFYTLLIITNTCGIWRSRVIAVRSEVDVPLARTCTFLAVNSGGDVFSDALWAVY